MLPTKIMRPEVGGRGGDMVAVVMGGWRRQGGV